MSTAAVRAAVREITSSARVRRERFGYGFGVTDESMVSEDVHGEPVAVASYPDRGEAEVTVAHLRASGIEAVIVDEVEGGTVPVDGEPGVVVMVPATDAETARQVLA